jgi:CRP/FNR family transcriptional regulator
MMRIVSRGPVDLARLRASCAECALGQLCLPAGITDDDLQRLDEIVRARRPLDAGASLFAAGAPVRALYVVRGGAVKTFSRDPAGNEQVLGFHLPGELVGLDGLSSGQHACSAVALERSSFCEVPLADIERIAERVPGLQRQLMRVASRELIEDHRHLVMMGRRQAQERLAIFLISLADRYVALGRSAELLHLPMSRYDLANYLGLVVETVSRLFTRLHDQGILEVDRKSVRVLDRARLDALCTEAEPADAAPKTGGGRVLGAT